MIIIKKDTEKKLCRQLKELKGQLPAYRCAILRFSAIDETDLPEEWFETLIHAVIDILYDENTQVFLCENNDVYIISRVMTHKFTSSLISHPLLLPWPVSLSRELAVLFEIGFEERGTVDEFFDYETNDTLKKVEEVCHASHNG